MLIAGTFTKEEKSSPHNQVKAMRKPAMKSGCPNVSPSRNYGLRFSFGTKRKIHKDGGWFSKREYTDGEAVSQQ